MGKHTPLSPELKALRDEFYSKAKACGWTHHDSDNKVADAVRLYFLSNKSKPIDEVRKDLFSSKYVGIVDPLVQLRNEFYDEARKYKWIDDRRPNSIGSGPSNFFFKHKHLPLDQLREVLFNSKFVQPNPEIYKDPYVLQEVLKPHRDKIQEVMSKFCNFTAGIRGTDHPESISELQRSIRNQLLEFIDNRAAVDIFVANVPVFSRQYHQQKRELNLQSV